MDTDLKQLTTRSPDGAGVTLTWRDLSIYAVQRRPGILRSQGEKYTRIINCVSGAVKPGSLVALMGSSGAGKSTLMAALAYRSPAGTAVEGDIRVDGVPVADFMRNISGFMHQQEIFVSSLTVKEHLIIMAHLKLDRTITTKMKQILVDDLMKRLGIMDNANTLIGEPGEKKVLSGGERKLLAFATELLTDPPLLFCDEPTTGLDSVSAQRLVELMHVMAAYGKTIVCTIHQPSSELFTMFNELILLAEGRVAFTGSSKGALEFFASHGYKCPETYNPADFLIQVLATTPGSEESSSLAVKRLCDHFAVSEAAQEVDLMVRLDRIADPGLSTKRISTFKPAYCSTKLMWLTWRALIQTFRDPTIQWMRLVQKIAIAVMAGLCYVGTDAHTQLGVQSIQGALFILVSENTFSPMYAALSAFNTEMPLFKREFHSGLYPTHVYYLSKTIATLPGLVVEPVLFVLAAYWLVGLRQSAYAVAMTSFIAVLTMNVSTACGCFFAAAFESVSMAMAYLVPFDYILMITSGVFITLSTMPQPLSWLQYMSWLMYSNEAFSIVQWSGVRNITCEEDIDPDLPCLEDGTEVLDKYSFSERHLCRNITMMIILYFLFHTLAYVSLRFRARTNSA